MSKYGADEGPNPAQRTVLQSSLWELHKGRCAYCRVVCRKFGASSDNAATVDHYVPLCRGGSWALSNLRLCCWKCNNEKGEMMPAAWYAMRPEYDHTAPVRVLKPIPLTRYERKLAAYNVIHQRQKETNAGFLHTDEHSDQTSNAARVLGC